MERLPPLPPLPTVDTPSVESLLDGFEAAPKWLMDRLAFLADCGSLFDRLALLGTLVRLWRPSTTDGVYRAIASGNLPSKAVHAWTATLTDAQRSEIQQRSYLVIEEVRNDLAEEEMGNAAERRDALESVLSVLLGYEEGYALAEALEDLDAQVDFQVEANDSYLIEVAVAQPDAWWAVIEDTHSRLPQRPA